MRTMCLMLGVAALFLWVAPEATASCWHCGSDSCCAEAPQGTTGSAYCAHNRDCTLFCFCYFCRTGGNSCAGTGPPECDSPFGACEEHQTFRVVPNGEPIDLPLMTDPPAVEPAVGFGSNAAGSCRAV